MRFCVICVVFFFMTIHAHLTSVSLRARVFFCLLLERLNEVRSRMRFIKFVALGRNSPARIHCRCRSFHIPCYGVHENISSWDWWFHVFTTAYLKTMNEFYMEEDVSAYTEMQQR